MEATSCPLSGPVMALTRHGSRTSPALRQGWIQSRLFLHRLSCSLPRLFLCSPYGSLFSNKLTARKSGRLCNDYLLILTRGAALAFQKIHYSISGKQLAQYLVILLLVIKHLRWYKILKLPKIPKGLIECICNTF